MPCYDKKLEAVRDDFIFSVDGKEVTEVDSVLTTGEVLDLIQVAISSYSCLYNGYEKLWRHSL
jgi:iron only hydrogenase large subunit-like protein